MGIVALQGGVTLKTRRERSLTLEEMVVLPRLTQCKVEETIMLKRSRVFFLLIALAFAATCPSMSGAESQNVCPVTKAPEHPFIPPPPLDTAEDGTFVLGTAGLWARVTTHWLLHQTSNKLPYHSESYSKYKVGNPPLAVVARRLDAPEPLVWAERVNGAWQSSGARPDDVAARSGIGAMITSLPIPAAGCWEISAHYTPAQDKVQTLTYTVWVEDVGIPASGGR
jgi:hypothetical protein